MTTVKLVKRIYFIFRYCTTILFFKVNNYDFKVNNYDFKVNNYDFKVNNYDFKVNNYDFSGITLVSLVFVKT